MATSSRSSRRAVAAISQEVTRALLSRWPLPKAEEGGDKEGRGTVLVVGGAPQMPGAIILAATAALRAGAGKLQIATCASIASLVGAQVPEAYVLALPEAKSGAITARSVSVVLEHAADAKALLIGPGMVDEEAITRWLPGLIMRLTGGATVVLDAAPLACLAKDAKALHGLDGRSIVTPHAGEMAMMLGRLKGTVAHHAAQTAREVAGSMKTVVALKGAETFIADPRGTVYCNRAGCVGLATSGSGDTLSGVVAGLAARGAPPFQARFGACSFTRGQEKCWPRRSALWAFLRVSS